MSPVGDRPRMRIAFVYDALVPYCSGGAERRYYELAIRLAVHHDVHYVTWRYWGPEASIVRDGITLHGVGSPRAFYGSDGKRTVREMVAFAQRLPAVLARLDVDVIDISATPYLPVYSAWLATRLTRTPLVATWHEYWGAHWQTYIPERPILARLARVAEATARPLADRRVAVSAFTARRMRAGRGGRRAVEVVANGVDLARLAVAPSVTRSDVIFIGRLIGEKRVDLLIRAVAAIVGDHPSVRCLVVGDGPERDRLEALAAELGVARQVRFAGRVPDDEVPRLLNASRILALPSAREGYGIAVVEAQACGLVPVVARSPLSAATDLVTNNVDGVLVDPSVEALAGALTGLLDDPHRRARLSAAARQTAASRGWDDRASDMERLYADVIAARLGARADARQDRPMPMTGPGAIPDRAAAAARNDW